MSTIPLSNLQPYRTTIKDLLDASPNKKKRARDAITIMYIVDEYEDKIDELEREIVRLKDSMSHMMYEPYKKEPEKEEEEEEEEELFFQEEHEDTYETPAPILTPADHDRITRCENN
jgi:hypothetical protein